MNDEHFVEQLTAYDEALRQGTSNETPVAPEEERLAEAIHCVNLLNRIWREPQAGDRDDAAWSAAGTRDSRDTDTSTANHCADATFPPDGTSINSSLSAFQSIGRFEIIRLLGQGGSGIVFLARDKELGRRVALKIPRPHTLLTPELRSRFQLETRAAAALSHSNIVTVYEAGSLGPVCYIASEFCAGPTLAEWLSRPEPVPFRLAAEWMAQLADAMQHAHSRGVLHRDLKPGNILLAQKDSAASPAVFNEHASAIELSGVVPRITDFGLAKFEANDGAMTRTGTLLGTAAYMAPEQVEGQTSQVDRRTDVYGLGTILYELMVGQPPFCEPTNVATLMAVRHRDPVSPRVLRRNVPPDLAAICMTCLEKDANKRYSSAADLATDLRRFLAGDSTMVRPIGPLRRGLRWVRRNRLLSAFITVVAVSLLGSAAGTFWHSIRIQNELNRSERLRAQALDRETKYRELSYAADLRLASQSLTNRDVTQATNLLKAHAPEAGEPDYRDVEWYLMNRFAVGEHTVIDDVGTPTYALALSPDLTRLATIGKDGNLRIYECPSGKPIMCVPTGHHEGNGVAFSNDSHAVATTGDDGALKIWNNSEMVRSIKAHEGDALGLVYSDPAKAWFTSGEDGRIRGWDATTGKAIAEFRENERSVTALAAAQNKHLLASVGRDDKLRVWDLTSNTHVKSWDLKARVPCVAFYDDSEVVAASLLDGRVKRWGVQDWRNLPPIQTPDHATYVAFSADGRHIAVGSGSGAIWLLRHDQHGPASTTKPMLVRTWQAHDGDVSGLVFTSKRNELVSAGEDGKLKRWPAPEDRLLDQVYRVNGKLLCVSPFSNRPFVATATATEIAIVDIRNGKTVQTLATDVTDWCSVAVASKTELVAAARQNGELWIWRDWRNSADKPQVRNLEGRLSRITLAPDGRFLVAEFYEPERGPVLVDLKNGKLHSGFIGERGCSAIAISPDGTRLALGEHDSNDILIWSIDGQEMVQRYAYDGDTIGLLAFSPNSERLAALDQSARLTVWDCHFGRLKWDSETSLGASPRYKSSIAFTPSGNSIVVTNHYGKTNFWHVESGREMVALDEHVGIISLLSFCNHGAYLCGIYHGRLCVVDTGMPTRDRQASGF